MKKLCLALVILTMLCGLCACGNNSDIPNENNSTQPTTGTQETSMTKEELLSQASELNIGALNEDISDNILRAEDTYIGNEYTYSGFVKEINSEYAQISNFKVYLAADDLKNLNRGEKVTVVGVIDSVSTDWVTMTNAYYVDNVFEITGVVDIAYMTYTTMDFVQHTRKPEEWYCTLKSSEGVEYHLEEDIPSEYREKFDKATINGVEVKGGDTITIRGRIIDDSVNPSANGTFAKGSLIVRDITVVQE